MHRWLAALLVLSASFACSGPPPESEVDGGARDAGEDAAVRADAGPAHSDGGSTDDDAGSSPDAGGTSGADGGAEGGAPSVVVGYGDACGGTSVCRSGLVCTDGHCAEGAPLPAGVACTISLECGDDHYCSAGTCRAARSARAAGGRCGGDSDCARGLRCSVGVCAVAGTSDVDDACSLDSDCLAGLLCDGLTCRPASFDASACVEVFNSAPYEAPGYLRVEPGEFVCIQQFPADPAGFGMGAVPDGEVVEVSLRWGGERPDGTYNWNCKLSTPFVGVGVVRHGAIWVQAPILTDAVSVTCDPTLFPAAGVRPGTGEMYTGIAQIALQPLGATSSSCESAPIEIAPLTTDTAGLAGAELEEALEGIAAHAMTLPAAERDAMSELLNAAQSILAEARVASVDLGYGGPYTEGTWETSGRNARGRIALDERSLRILDAYLRNAERTNPWRDAPSLLSLISGCWQNVGTGMICVGLGAMAFAALTAGGIAAAASTPLFAAGAAVFAGGVVAYGALRRAGSTLAAHWREVRDEHNADYDVLFDQFSPTDDRMRQISDCDPGECGEARSICSDCSALFCSPSDGRRHQSYCYYGSCRTMPLPCPPDQMCVGDGSCE